MGAVLTAADRERLAKILSLLSSDRPGEVVAAGAAATRLIRERGVGWADIIAPAPVAAEPAWSSTRQSRASWTTPSAWRDTTRYCLCYPQMLTDWEAAFLDGLLSRRSLSAKQIATLDAIAAKVTGAGGAG